MNQLELIDTVVPMLSADYKERFCAEYNQLCIRGRKLIKMLEKWEAGELNFTPTCPRELLEKQVGLMNELMGVMEERARIEGIDFSAYESCLKNPDPYSPIELIKIALDSEQHKSKELERSLSEQRQQNAAELEALQKVSRAERCKNNRALSVLELLTEYLKK
jgi:hypothetical protein